MYSFTVGICATDDSCNVERLMERVSLELLPLHCRISDMVVVVSGSTDGTDSIVDSFSSGLNKTVILEEKRKGKSEAVNRILNCMKGEHLIMVNGDALPQPGAISCMMQRLLEGGSAVVCALPVPAESDCPVLVRHICEFLWKLHNRTMEILQENGERIHLSDEMIGLNQEALTPLPEGTVNDGAYVAARAQQYGQKVSFCSEARVNVSVPSDLHGLYLQRRRILYGHMLVREMAGSAPGTVEFKLIEKPLLSFRILLSTLKEYPAGAALLPVILAVELRALSAALRDRMRKKDIHTIWQRTENAAWRKV